ncbi:kinesin light chain [Ophiostoma piceae UAMH 11346]|uniref:Kinesin light chain n=1 Tax=Ophiostoma piceae (strain UAMH 11346) TaxID=1262450 RepID=S3BY40_OPHP1|nr:kinesin light chain [Ophiostoma piceae UAMH 11346]
MASSSRSPEYRHGLKVWRAPPSPNLDICFIHGLNGDRDKTWTAKNDETPWPERFLAQSFAHARLLTYGYDSEVLPSGTASTGTLRTIADGLNRSLKDNRELAQLPALPIVFVAHSLGGLVCKRATYRSFHNKDPKIKAIASCLLGIIFMGTPHTGSFYANIFSPLVSGISFFKSAGKPLLKALTKDSETATDLNEDFVGVVDLVDKTTNIFCFFEGKPKRGVKHLIVNRASATFSQWPSQMINSDHSNMVKFQSDADPDFQFLCGVLRDFLRSERAKSFSSLQPPVMVPPAFEALFQSSTHILEALVPQPTASPTGNGHHFQSQHSQDLSHTAGSQLSIRDVGQQPSSEDDSSTISDQDSVTSHRNNPPIRPSTPPLPLSTSTPNTSYPHTLPMQSNAVTTPADTRPLPIFDLYFSKNRNFIGREDTLENLQSLFFDEGYNTVALSGLGGIGKTQVANAFAYWVKESKPDNSVIWLPTVTRAAFEEAYSKVAKMLSIKVEDKRDLLIDVRNYINDDKTRPWFIIIDNADDPKLLCDKKSPNTLDWYFPNGDHVRTLVTTRNKIVARTLADETIELVAFGPEHAVEMARRLLCQKWQILASDESSLHQLLQELEFLPLAISQAMAYMHRTNTPAHDYLQLLRETDSSRVDLLGDEQPDRSRYKESAHAVATTWLVSFEHIQNTNPDAVIIFEFLSQVLPKSVPLSMLPMIGSKAATAKAINDLQAYNFIGAGGSPELGRQEWQI